MFGKMCLGLKSATWISQGQEWPPITFLFICSTSSGPSLESPKRPLGDWSSSIWPNESNIGTFIIPHKSLWKQFFSSICCLSRIAVHNMWILAALNGCRSSNCWCDMRVTEPGRQFPFRTGCKIPVWNIILSHHFLSKPNDYLKITLWVAGAVDTGLGETEPCAGAAAGEVRFWVRGAGGWSCVPSVGVRVFPLSWLPLSPPLSWCMAS